MNEVHGETANPNKGKMLRGPVYIVVKVTLKNDSYN